jgi:hypothetical protein
MQHFSILPLLAFAGLAALSLSGLRAQSSGPSSGGPSAAASGLGPSIFSVGTSTTIGTQPWAYLLWQPSEVGFMEGRRFGIYRKSGPPSAAALFSLQGEAQPRLSLAAIAQALVTAGKLGDDLEDLEHGLAALLKDDAAAAEGLSTEERVLAVMRAAIDDKSVLERLQVMSRVHPAISLILGQAHAEALPAAGVYTYEVRLLDEATGADAGVVGRVVINTTPTALPAPTDLFTFFEPNPRGHLNAKIRWANPPALRLRALEHYGYNIYRVAKAEAIARGWVSSPPGTAALRAAVGNNSNPSFKRVNEVPVLTENDLDAAAANNAADLATYFFADDNGRFNPEHPAVPLQDGAEYYYYVSALDVLGRDGLISSGKLAAVYDTYPPEAPREVAVSNEYGMVGMARRQFLRVSWEAPPQDGDGAALDGYLIYRWESDRLITASNKAVAAGGPLPAHIGFVKHLAPKTSYSFDDVGAGAPGVADAGKTFWYTVRAVDASKRPGGGNKSGNSVPAYGVIRDRQGPAAATGSIRLSCLNPLVSPDPKQTLNEGGKVILFCRAPLDSRLAWAEFSMGNISLGQYAMRRRVLQVAGRAEEWLVAEVVLPAARFYGGGSKTQEQRVQCRVATHSGRLSAPAFHDLPSTLEADRGLLVPFKGETQRVTGLLGDAVCGSRHDLFGEGTPRQRFSICGDLTISSGTREYKIYRRVGNGPLSLVDFGPRKTNVKGKAISGFNQILNPAVPVGWCDSTAPSGVANLCYFVQCFDEHGNASPLASLGCVETVGDLPAPTLLPLEAGTSAASMRVRWFGNGHESTRYEVFISRAGSAYNTASAAVSGQLSADLSPKDGSGVRIAQRVLGEAQGDFSVHETVMVSMLQAIAAEPSSPTPSPLSNGSLFTYEVPVEMGVAYKVCVRAVGPGHVYGSRAASSLSNVQEFVWAAVSAPTLGSVPWPARSSMAAGSASAFHPDIIASSLAGRVPGFEGAGVRIGAVNLAPDAETSGPLDTLLDGGRTTSPNDPQKGLLPGFPPRLSNNEDFGSIIRSFFPGGTDPMQILFANEPLAQQERARQQRDPGRVLPLVLYRYEVAGTLHAAAELSKDVVQVTPLMEGIAYQRFENKTDFKTYTIIHDPWVVLIPKADAAYSKTHELYLLDRSPVTSGAKYRYVLVRFNSQSMEIDRVLETPVVNIP